MQHLFTNGRATRRKIRAWRAVFPNSFSNHVASWKSFASWLPQSHEKPRTKMQARA
jgi:hypothetical protein